MRTPRSYILVAGVLVLAGAFILKSTYSSGGNQQNRDVRKIELLNKTHALQVTRAEVVGKQIHLAVKNGSQKNVNWFRISVGKSASVEADFAFTDLGVLPPGETYDDYYPIDSDSDTVTIAVVAVVFEDKTDEGEANYAHFIRETRAGQQIALERLLPLVQQSADSSDDAPDATLQKLEAEAATEAATDKQLSEAKLIGMRNVRDRIVTEVKRIRYERNKDNRRDVRQDLNSVISKYQRIEAKLK